LKIFLRNTWLWLLQLFPSQRRWLEQGARRDGMVTYRYEKGMAFLPDLNGGKAFPQVYCVPLSPQRLDYTVGASVLFTDDVIFAPEKKGLFQLVVLLQSVEQIRHSDLANVGKWSDGQVYASEVTYIIEDPDCPGMEYTSETAATVNGDRGGHTVVRIATAKEFAASPQCLNRPEPQYYDEYRLGKEVMGRKFAILRKDRFVYATCNDLEQLRDALQRIEQVLTGEKST
jgi:hypothetical protein